VYCTGTYRALALAVIREALRDPQVARWYPDCEGFRFWCAVAAVDPDQLRGLLAQRSRRVTPDTTGTPIVA
jgi:hypothetical protein